MREPIPQRDALRLQLAMIAGNEPATSFIEIRPLDPPGRQVFVPVRQYAKAMAEIERLNERHQVYLGATPRTRQAGTADAVERVWCLWADCDTPEAVARLRKFRPWPTMVNRSGSAGRLHAWWAQSSPLSPTAAEFANKRLAYALGADRAATDRARIMRPIGSLNKKTDPPARVECVRCELETFTAAEVVGHLPDPPDLRSVRRPAGPPASVPSDAALAGLVRTVREAQPGQRNNLLFWASCRLQDHGLDDAAACEALRQAALDAGLPEHEVTRTIASALESRRAAA